MSTHRTPLSLTTYLGLVLDEATDLCAFDGLYGRHRTLSTATRWSSLSDGRSRRADEDRAHTRKYLATRRPPVDYFDALAAQQALPFSAALAPSKRCLRRVAGADPPPLFAAVLRRDFAAVERAHDRGGGGDRDAASGDSALHVALRVLVEPEVVAQGVAFWGYAEMALRLLELDARLSENDAGALATDPLRSFIGESDGGRAVPLDTLLKRSQRDARQLRQIHVIAKLRILTAANPLTAALRLSKQMRECQERFKLPLLAGFAASYENVAAAVVALPLQPQSGREAAELAWARDAFGERSKHVAFGLLRVDANQSHQTSALALALAYNSTLFVTAPGVTLVLQSMWRGAGAASRRNRIRTRAGCDDCDDASDLEEDKVFLEKLAASYSPKMQFYIDFCFDASFAALFTWTLVYAAARPGPFLRFFLFLCIFGKALREVDDSVLWP